MANTMWVKIKAELDALKEKLSAVAPASATDHSKIISGFQTQLDGFKAELDAKDKSISDLMATVEKHVATIAARDEEIKKLKGEATTAGEVAIKIVSSQGIDPALIPAAKAGEGGAEKKSLRAQYQELLVAGKTQEAGEFYKANANKPDFYK